MVVVINGTDGISTPDVVVDSIGTDTSTAVVVRTNGVERMRVNDAGNLHVGGTSAFTSRACIIKDGPTSHVNSHLELISNGGDVVLALHASGNSAAILDHVRGGSGIRVRNAGRNSFAPIAASAFNVNSDYRLKENVAPITDAANRVLSLNPVRFNFIADPDQTVDGFLAHEAQAVVPESVTGEKDGEEMQAIDQSKLVPLLTAALQEALQTIQALEARVAALETPA